MCSEDPENKTNQKEKHQHPIFRHQMTSAVKTEHPPLIQCSQGEEAARDSRSETKTQRDNLQRTKIIYLFLAKAV